MKHEQFIILVTVTKIMDGLFIFHENLIIMSTYFRLIHQFSSVNTAQIIPAVLQQQCNIPAIFQYRCNVAARFCVTWIRHQIKDVSYLRYAC